MTDAEIEATLRKVDALSIRALDALAKAEQLVRDVHALRLAILTEMPTTGRQ